MSINNALDHEEQALLEAYETGQFESVLDDNRRDYLTRIAEESLSIEQGITIHLSRPDLEALQRRAQEEGISYPSLASSILHKYITGGLKDISVC